VNPSIGKGIEDHGIGIDLTRVSSTDGPRKGLGLAVMEERVGMLKGVIDIVGREGKDTRITFVIPVTKEGTL
jgi:two-component system, NarL family, sensor histidine kinase DegS